MVLQFTKWSSPMRNEELEGKHLWKYLYFETGIRLCSHVIRPHKPPLLSSCLCMKATDGRVRSRQIRTQDTEACPSARLKTRRNSSKKRTTPSCSVCVCVCVGARARVCVCALVCVRVCYYAVSGQTHRLLSRLVTPPLIPSLRLSIYSMHRLFRLH